MGSKLVATYYIGLDIYDIFGCWDGEQKENSYDFYDIYEVDKSSNSSECINTGDPFYEFPSYDTVYEFTKK